MKYARHILIVVISMGIFISCAAPARPEIKPRNLWVGFWYISEDGFDQAVQDRLVVELRQNGEFTTGYYDGNRFTRTMATGNWNVKEDKFIDVREFQTLESSYEVVSHDRVILSISEEQRLFMIRKEK